MKHNVTKKMRILQTIIISLFILFLFSLLFDGEEKENLTTEVMKKNQSNSTQSQMEIDLLKQAKLSESDIKVLQEKRLKNINAFSGENSFFSEIKIEKGNYPTVYLNEVFYRQPHKIQESMVSEVALYYLTQSTKNTLLILKDNTSNEKVGIYITPKATIFSKNMKGIELNAKGIRLSEEYKLQPKERKLQAERAKIIEGMISQGLIQKITTYSDYPRIYVTNKFMHMNFDEKQVLIGAVVAYYMTKNPNSTAARLKSSITGQEIGIYRTTEFGDPFNVGLEIYKS
ncbi:hypothetical protein L3V86_04340 [Thiotrichales bacterium 19S11-10]|nr:hypothetical protein [Thiotrichales bacterium 19S11-10]